MVVYMECEKNSMRPIIAVDVDGVLSPVCPIGELPEPEFRVWHKKDYVLYENVAFIEPALTMLNNLDESGEADVTFHTSWGPEIYETLNVSWDMIPEYETRYSIEGWWKKDLVLRLIDAYKRPVIWIDDDISDALDSGELSGLIEEQKKLLSVISPHTFEGLKPEDLESITKLVKQIKGR